MTNSSYQDFRTHILIILDIVHAEDLFGPNLGPKEIQQERYQIMSS